MENAGSFSLNRIIIKSNSAHSYISLFGESSNYINSHNGEINLENLNPLEIAYAKIVKDSTELYVTANTDFELQNMESTIAKKIFKQYNLNVDTGMVKIKYLNKGNL